MQPNAALPESHGSSPLSLANPMPLPVIAGVKTLPTKAQDDELIEHEWVEAIKHALQAEANDPHALNDTIASLRRYYLHKRYGRDDKVPKASI